MVAADKGSLQGIFHLVHEGEISSIFNFIGEDGTERGIHLIQEHRFDESGQSVLTGFHSLQSFFLGPLGKLFLILYS